MRMVGSKSEKEAISRCSGGQGNAHLELHGARDES